MSSSAALRHCGTAALCAGIAARRDGASVLVLEGAPKFYRGGNTRHTNAFFLGGGRAMLNALYGTAEELGIDIMYDAPVTALEIDNGMFLSATMMHDGTGHQVRARTLVAAAGGFESNIEYRISNG